MGLATSVLWIYKLERDLNRYNDVDINSDIVITDIVLILMNKLCWIYHVAG